MTALPCCVHARRALALPLFFVLHLGEDSVLPSCFLCVKTLKAVRPLTSSCILMCLGLRNILARFLRRLHTGMVHTTEKIRFISLFSAIYSHVCITRARFLSPPSPSEACCREGPSAAKETEQYVISGKTDEWRLLRMLLWDHQDLGVNRKTKKCYRQHEKQQVDNQFDVC